MRIVREILQLIYPTHCSTCSRVMYTHERSICTYCESELPYTDLHFFPYENEIHLRLKGRIPLTIGLAMFYFYPDNVTEKLIHAIKYKSKPDLAFEFGKKYASLISTFDLFDDIDILCPVPMHWKKKRKRGFNQSDFLADGIASIIKKSVLKDLLIKTRNSDTMTHLNRVERMAINKELYLFSGKYQINGKHICLVDDVLTTGATLETCAQALLDAGASKVSIVCMAMRK